MRKGPSTEQVRADIGPIFEAFGSAMFDAQHLERGLDLLLRMAVASGLPMATRHLALNRLEETMGPTLDELTRRSIVSREFGKLVIDAIRIRNFLVHRYWGDTGRVKCLGTPPGRSWLVGDLNRIRDALMHTNRQVDAVIDSYLKEHRASLSALSDPEWEKYESGSEPPPELLN